MACLIPLREKNSLKGSETVWANVRDTDGGMSGSLAKNKVISRPGSINSAVMMNTLCQGIKSAKIKLSDPGTKAAIR